jgi:purine nucleosidase
VAPVILDTDIGTNVDDALALAVLLGSPEADLAAVTTVYGNATLRARLARRLLGTAGRDDVRVAAGATTPLSGVDVFWAGHEGALHAELDREPTDPVAAHDVLIETARHHSGALDVLAVGPLTNLALALRRDPGFARHVRRVVVMGGDFADAGRQAERNFRSDAVAAREVLGSGLDVTVVGLDVTTTVRWGEPEAGWIGGSGPFGNALRAELEAYWRYRGEPWSHPHDALAALLLVRPDLFTVRERGIRVETGGKQAGLVVDDAASKRRAVARAVDAAATAELLARIGRSEDGGPWPAQRSDASSA